MDSPKPVTPDDDIVTLKNGDVRIRLSLEGGRVMTFLMTPQSAVSLACRILGEIDDRYDGPPPPELDGSTVVH